MRERIHIGIGTNRIGVWRERFQAALEELKLPCPLTFDTIDFSAHDWQEAARGADAIVWKPEFLGTEAVTQIRAQLTVLESCLGKLVVPNARTIWHFENKIAQSYLFECYGIPTPATFSSFDYRDALSALDHVRWPLVFKEPYGASGANVKLVRGNREARRLITRRFDEQIWNEERARSGTAVRFLLANASKSWFRSVARRKIARGPLGCESRPVIYWQEFVPNNDADLRITAIGDRIAFGFWRQNRPDDFRASGSGRIDYARPIPPDLVLYCMRLNERLGFDSMAYDIVFGEQGFVILEMSYGYMDKAVYDAPGRFERGEDDTLRFVEGHCWPQTAWIEWLGERIKRELLSGSAKSIL
jgi:glutathione synthase/RimK-type ligase-like ATP-grasp enzyme